jgi:hypothetical protein
MAMAYKVSLESDERGGKVYSNDILRNTKIKKRLKSNFEYQSFKEWLDFLDKLERTLKTEIDILDKQFRIIEQLVALVMVEGHILTHCREVTDYERSN